MFFFIVSVFTGSPVSRLSKTYRAGHTVYSSTVTAHLTERHWFRKWFPPFYISIDVSWNAYVKSVKPETKPTISEMNRDHKTFDSVQNKILKMAEKGGTGAQWLALLPQALPIPGLGRVWSPVWAGPFCVELAWLSSGCSGFLPP